MKSVCIPECKSLPITSMDFATVEYYKRPRTDINVGGTEFRFVCDQGYFLVDRPGSLRVSCEKLRDGFQEDLGICGVIGFRCDLNGIWHSLERSRCITSKFNVPL